jgi:Protein of unknown function (DUF3592)
MVINNSKSKYVITFLCMPLIPIGLSMCWQGLENIRSAEATQQWPTAPGMITYSKVSNSGNNYKNTSTKIHKPVIKYKYLVKSVQYQNNNIYLGDDQIPNVVPYADEMVAKYAPNQKVVIYYSPIDPQLSVLETGVSQVFFQRLVYGGILISIGLAIPLIFWVFSKLQRTVPEV